MRNLKIQEIPASTILLGCLLLVAFSLSVAFRSLWLGNIPGVNGDEAWYGIQVRNISTIRSWRTPTGNILNPFHMIPLAIFQYLLPSGFVALRLPSLLSGLLLIFLGWLLLRKTMNPTFALVFALLAAGSPDLMAYAPFWLGCKPYRAGKPVRNVLHAAKAVEISSGRANLRNDRASYQHPSRSNLGYFCCRAIHAGWLEKMGSGSLDLGRRRATDPFCRITFRLKGWY